jgi:DNA-binding MarR family transcriptional regulator
MTENDHQFQQDAPISGEEVPLEDFLCFSLYSANHAMHRVYKPLLAELGLTYPQYLAMVALWEEDSVLVGALCDRLHLESSTVTPLLKRLEAMGLLTRARDKADERQVRVNLTQAGQDLRLKTKRFAACVVSSTGMSLEDVQALQRQIMRLRDNLRSAAE